MDGGAHPGSRPVRRPFTAALPIRRTLPAATGDGERPATKVAPEGPAATKSGQAGLGADAEGLRTLPAATGDGEREAERAGNDARGGDYADPAGGGKAERVH